MILDRFRLTDQVAIVTGAGRGIGRGIALGFAEAGAHIVCAARTKEDLDAVIEEVSSHGQKALAVQCDVTKREDLERLLAVTLSEMGRVDILVNNAGGGPFKPALRTGEKAFEETIRFSLTAPFLLTRLVASSMIESGSGCILNISSALGHMVERGFVAYGTAKAGLAHMTELLGYEFAPKVRVNALAVGSVETPALAPFLADETMRSRMANDTPMKRIGTPEDVALAAIYLCSSASAWVTGKVFEVDGGTTHSNFPIKTPDL